MGCTSIAHEEEKSTYKVNGPYLIMGEMKEFRKKNFGLEKEVEKL